MLAHDNGTRQQCAENLIRTIQGECPYERTKGIDRQLIDAPSVDRNRLKANVSWLVKTYEPRIDKSSLTVGADDAEGGAFSLNLTVQ